MKNKLLRKMVILLVIIAMLGTASILFIHFYLKEENRDQQTIDEVLKTTVDVQQITTNLADECIIRISFKIQADSKEAKEELEKRDFQVKNIIILTLSEKTEKDLKGKEGQLNLEQELKEKISSIMLNGKVEKVYITESLLQ